ncbi:histidine phosphatase family protein [Verminephrobacter eiseniae]|nr:histidine phosphatase family protein [Verminephrobacter eiseniae]KAB7622749.1 histidine phosphatase family protein [Verminephrobacter sp. Larva24]MCW5234273.1 histidine phosphatase family protein [Verminephrobacter eiseniae]MCW5262432.1 histidine phosphatase family protein [Verminephrobacter eiseniae]MCW5282873.1 histidine phosphatase family protein [Verminephrobacter eiseniae]MCW5294170.1 histidine phosphatase family protein [Verminephrobacter eiseniae]
MTELILIRHGETDWNRELRFQGQVDVALNSLGHEQSRRLAERLAAERPVVDHLICSDLVRTRQTAQPSLQVLFPQACIETLTDSSLREQDFGVVDGMRVDDIKAAHADAWARWLRFDADSGMPGGETTRQFHTRVMGAVRRIAQQHAGKTVLVVTHGGVLDMIWRTAHGQGLAGPRQSDIPNAGLSRVRVDGDALQVLHWADTRHLADLPAQPVYDQARLLVR